MRTHILSAVVAAFAVVAVLTSNSAAQAALLGYWKLDENSGNTAFDSSGNGYNGTLFSANGGTIPTVNQAGIIGKAYHFNGTGANGNGAATQSEVRVSTSDLAGMMQFSMTTWIYLPSGIQTAGNRLRIINNWQAPNHSYILDANAGGQTFFLSHDGWTLTSNTSIGYDGWHQVTATYNGVNGHKRLYLDGNELAFADGNDNVAMRPNNLLIFGGGGLNGYGVRGYLDDVGIWNQTLTATEIKAIYNTPLLSELGSATNGNYGLADMNALFGLFAAQSGSVAIGAQTWQYATNFTGHAAGDAWFDNGTFFVQLDAFGNGVSASAIPEPSSWLLAAIGLSALAFYRRRRRDG